MNELQAQKKFLSLLSTPLALLLHLKEMVETSLLMDLCPLQDSFRFRSRYVAWKAGSLLIDEKGELQMDLVHRLYQELGFALFPMGPNMEPDILFYSHLYHCLGVLKENSKISFLLKKFSIPLCHKKAEEMVRETLWPERVGKIQTQHVRRAALIAWFTLLRQTTGSCFGTAPAILVQKQNPELFFQDLESLLSTGQLRRVAKGKQLAVPLSPLWGMGDLRKPFGPILSPAHCPGIRICLEQVGYPLKDLPNEWRAMDGQIGHPEGVLRSLLLKHLDLSEEILEEEQSLKELRIRSISGLSGSIQYQRQSEREKRVDLFQKKFSEALSSFRAMTDTALLRAWEYTVASFSDVKLDFARWNLYIGLGFHLEQKGGIADFLYHWMEEKLDQCNQEAARLHQEYQRALAEYQSLEALLSRSLSDAREYQLKGELASVVHTVNTALSLRDRTIAMGEALSQGFNQLMRQFDEKLQDHFQEVFDPSVADESADFYEDSPAGFRLVYKHRRSDASLWTRIQDGKEYIAALSDFFYAIELEISLPEPLGESFVSEVMRAVGHFIHTDAFLDSAMKRAQEKQRLSPWHYVSGGTMQTLLENYFGQEKAFQEHSIVPHSEEALFSHLQQWMGGKKGPFLMHSPTHAFVFYPEWMKPLEKKTSIWEIDLERQEFLVHQLSNRLSSLEGPLFVHLLRQKIGQGNSLAFRQHLMEALHQTAFPRIKNIESVVDGFLYEHFPLLSVEEANRAAREILSLFSISPTPSFEGPFVGSLTFQKNLLAFVMEAKKEPFSARDWRMEIADAARAISVAYPNPIFFADTNWGGWFFAWIHHPITGKLGIWRMNRTGSEGAPMSEWAHFLSSQNEFPWVVID